MKVIGTPVGRRLWAKALSDISTRTIFRWGTTENYPCPTVPRREAIINTVNKLKMAKILNEKLGKRFPVLDPNGELAYPVVKKYKYHKRGKLISLAHSDCEIETERYYYMPFIPTKTEYRVITDRVGRNYVIFRKIRLNNDDFRLNHSLGNCKFHRVLPENVPDIVKELAWKSVDALDLIVGGVDIGIGENKKAIIFEVNSAPQMATVERCLLFKDAVITAIGGSYE